MLYFVCFVYLFGCQTDSSNDVISSPEVEIDSTETMDLSELEVEEKDSTDVEIDKRYADEDLQKTHEEIVKKYGEQWDFCMCIVKNDSVQKALESDDLSDEAFDLLFERSEFIDTKCKELLIFDNSTPEKREEHQKRVKNCLRAAK